MAVTLNASTSAGLIQTADTTGVISLQNNGTTGLTLTSGNLQFNSGSGSVATAYGCRAWVNFNGTGTVSITGSGNVSSITDGGTGLYTINFTTAMPDTNFSAAALNTGEARYVSYISRTVSTLGVSTANSAPTRFDVDPIMVSVFR
jgi:hypothetical protein